MVARQAIQDVHGLGGEMRTMGFALEQPPVSRLTDFLTPNDRVFSVHHMGVPSTAPESWRLLITGMVGREITISLPELETMPQIEVLAFHECAGSPLRPTQPVRRVANVIWRGVRLRDVLDLAGVSPLARFLWSYGADHGEFGGVSSPCYLKDLPIEESRRDDVLLATHINGEKLPDKRGGPVRLVVPGFYGTNSTKWLARLEPREIRSPGYFTTALYNDRVVENGHESSRPVWRVAPHSIITSPADGAQLSRTTHRIRGWAWGYDEIARVEVSTDGGVTWRQAQLSPRQEYSWQEFTSDWTPVSTGSYTLKCRATDRRGVGQPEGGARNEVFALAVAVA